MPDPIPFQPPIHKSPPPVRPLVQLQDVWLSRGGNSVLNGITADLGSAQITAIMGANGAGKTQLLRVLGGLNRPDRGDVVFSWPPAPEKRRVALVFQRPILLRRSTQANLHHALKHYGVARKDRASRVAELLAFGELTHAAKRPARALSGGEQQRLALIRALGAAPDLLLLDEPAANLDPRSTAALEALIRRAASQGVKVILVTHDQGQARRLAQDILFLHAGTVAEHTTAHSFFTAPRSPQALAYLNGHLFV